MFHLIVARRFHLNGELTEHNLWLKQKFERVYVLIWTALSKYPLDNFGTVVGENPDHVCWVEVPETSAFLPQGLTTPVRP